MGSKEFDEILENIGGMGRYQIVMYFFLGLVGFPIGMHYMVSVFIAAVPQHHCATPSLHNNFSRTDILNAFIPYETIDGEIQRSKCKIANWPLLTDTEGNNSIKQFINYTQESIRNGIYATGGNNSIKRLTEYTQESIERNGTYSVTFNDSGIGQTYCDSWEYDTSEYTSTIVSEFDLVCGQSWRRALASSIFMSGCMVGAVIFGGLSDRFGRKPVLLVAILLTIICGTGAAFAPEYWSFVLLRAVVASGAAGSSIVAFVLILEMMPPKGRMIPGIFYHAFFCGGYTLLSLIAFGVRNHVHVQLIVSLPPLVLLIYFWLADESPRWLLAEGRVDEANTILTKMARINKAEYSDKLLIDSQINNEVD